MPHLEWIGKEKVVNHAKEVPFHVLERKYSFGKGRDGMVIHGDNLLALKSLLPEYEGKVKCIYIDPPYNTGNEGWVYNDNVHDPRIKKWLGEVVGKEGEDLSRHDKWLCMMYPRLRLLHRLLAQDGVIAVSINDHELFHLGELMNEIFGVKNRLACAPWRSEPSGGKEKTVLRTGHEYILFYAKDDVSNFSREEKLTGTLDLVDKFGSYKKGRELRKWGAGSERSDRPKMWFPVTAPDGEIVYPYRNDGVEGRWRWGKDNPEMKKILKDPEYAHWEKCPYDDGISIDGAKKRWVPFEKIRVESKFFGWNSWLDNLGTNADATATIKAIFGEKAFDTPKPVSLLEWIVSLYDSKDSIILDSFAGSGTTAHAVLNLNKKDGGKRKFILIEMMDYAETITAERVRRVISGYGEGKNAVPGTGGGFDFYEIGAPLMEKGMLNESVSPAKIRRYVWYMETHDVPMESMGKEDFLGIFQQTAYYFHYRPKEVTLLDEDYLATITAKAESYVIYADRCLLSEEFMARHHIVFKKIPRDIAVL